MPSSAGGSAKISQPSWASTFGKPSTSRKKARPLGILGVNDRVRAGDHVLPPGRPANCGVVRSCLAGRAQPPGGAPAGRAGVLAESVRLAAGPRELLIARRLGRATATL